MNKFGIIGLGKMGGAIAQRMTTEGLNVLGWTRSGRTLVGVSTVQDLDTLVAQSETLILSLFDDVAVKNILNNSGYF